MAAPPPVGFFYIKILQLAQSYAIGTISLRRGGEGRNRSSARHQVSEDFTLGGPATKKINDIN